MNHEDTKTQSTHDIDVIPEETERVATAVIDAAYSVHSELGPGLLESIYEQCMIVELGQRELCYERQLALPITYKGHRIETGIRLDLVVEDQVVVELKAVEQLMPVHAAQLLTYLKLTGQRLGLLINFNVPIIKNGIHRFAL
jgi:GxxExxY protein